MNDFTKEELEIIKHGIDWVFEYQEYKNKPPILALGRKIQSMIDNYCEHEWYVSNKEFHTSYAKCTKCGASYDNQ